MSIQLFLQTTIPLFSLIFIGYASRKYGILENGDERVFSTYLYYIGLPSLLLIDIAEIKFTSKAIEYIGISMIPLVLMFILISIFGLILGMKYESLILLLITSSFGNLGFYGIAFVNFAFNSLEAETLAALVVSSVNTVGFIVSFVLLESSNNSETNLFRKTISNLSVNPLILSILMGLGLNFLLPELPTILTSFLHMIASSVSPVAIYMLGISIYGKDFGNLIEASLISSVRLIILPGLAFLVSKLFQLPLLETSIMVIMYGTPLALSMVILSKRYEFEEKRVSSVVIVSSLVSGVSLNLWLLLIDLLY